MDLGAYAQIEDLESLLTKNNISVPRLRGLRLMKDETALTKEDIEKRARFIGLSNCEDVCRYVREGTLDVIEYGGSKDRIVKRCFIRDEENQITEINWKNVHGKRRKAFKFELKKARKRVEDNFNVFNKYVGRDDVLYIHARIGGLNWIPYDGPTEIATQPWFLEKVDDPFDNTYCDIYALLPER